MNKRADDGLLQGILVAVTHQRHVDLDELGREQGQGSEAGVARAGVVKGEAVTALARLSASLQEIRHVGDGRALGRLGYGPSAGPDVG